VAYSITFPDRYVALAGLPLSTPAWELLNIEVLLGGSAMRGENLVIPGASGTRPRRRRITERVVTLEMAITGAYTPEGELNADGAAGLLGNLEALAAVLDPPATNDSLIAVTLFWRDQQRNGFAQISNYEIGAYVSPADVPMSIDLVLPAGRLVP
jgi:hypothetical protein